MRLTISLLFAFAGAASCGATLPPDVEGYEARCVRMNALPIPRYDGDPHAGFKNVYACNVDVLALRANARPFPDGTMMVKESRREGEEAPWLIAVARKQDGAWQWDEYTRNFPDEDFRRIAASQSVCTSCHGKISAADFIYTTYTGM